MSSTRVAVVGASGYTGGELLRLLLEHPAVTIAGVYAHSKAGEPLTKVFPHLTGRLDMTLAAFDADAIARAADVAFLCLPHAASATAAAQLLERKVRVLDLSADFRLRDAATYDAWYATKEHPHHPAPTLLPEAVYGLPELPGKRAALAKTRLVAVPGCYPTASMLPLAPLLAAKLIQPDGLVIDAKSGASGAGRTPGAGTHLPEIVDGIRPYKVAGTHRHTAEIEQELGLVAGRALAVTFTPHLLPISRGILACAYATPTDPARPAAAYHEALAAAYAGEPFVHVLAPGQLPDTSHVRGSNHAHVGVAYDARTKRVLAMGAIDNLTKGASGQAVQCLNLLLGLPETTGLGAVAVFP